ncbi:hypothetical protein HPB47_020771 [Ixodes persulcatus]|uniref:Uncharacterized protein n=1 Tax=Ixodes persulcatus TaxID=34615 RepID=A0AC60QHR8_IXOPE|nr:hypothetical protein HPB47_020771 [Ixodes persulcatus]
MWSAVSQAFGLIKQSRPDLLSNPRASQDNVGIVVENFLEEDIANDRSSDFAGGPCCSVTRRAASEELEGGLATHLEKNHWHEAAGQPEVVPESTGESVCSQHYLGHPASPQVVSGPERGYDKFSLARKEALVQVLSQCGKVKAINRATFRDRPDVSTGTRVGKMEMLKPVPNFVPIQRHGVMVDYRGLRRVCSRCRLDGHIGHACKTPCCDRCGLFRHATAGCTALTSGAATAARPLTASSVKDICPLRQRLRRQRRHWDALKFDCRFFATAAGKSLRRRETEALNEVFRHIRIVQRGGVRTYFMSGYLTILCDHHQRLLGASSQSDAPQRLHDQPVNDPEVLRFLRAIRAGLV